MEQTVRRWADRDLADYGHLLDFYRQGARICHAGEDGLVLKDDAINICYTVGDVAELEPLRGCLLVLTDSRAVVDALTAEGAYRDVIPCTQAAYLKQEPPQARQTDVVIRPLTTADLDFVLENYHNPGAYEAHIRDRIAAGMLGGMVDGKLAGFAGVHQEGCMGMLEVLPIFRRRGVAEVLECAVIRRQLEAGKLPYCHVREGNRASWALQDKLGLTFGRRTLYWLG